MVTKVMGGESGNTTVKIDGKTYYASFSPIIMDGDSDSWSAVTVQSKSKLFAPLYMAVIFAVIIALAAFVLAFIVLRNITKRITDPISELTDAIELASEGDFSVRATGSGAAEIKVLADSFNGMTEKISRILHETIGLINDVKGSAERPDDISRQSETAAADMDDISQGAASRLNDTQKALELTDNLKQISARLMEMNGRLNDVTLETKNAGSEGLKSVE